MNMDKASKTELEEASGFFARIPVAECCGKCGRTVFFRLKVNGRLVLVHGDNSYCVAGGIQG